MARKAKLDDRLFSRRAKSLRANYKKIRLHILIVCEGEKTEPNYFKSIEKLLPQGVVKLDIHGVGRNTISLVNDTIEKITKAKNEERKNKFFRSYDKIWVVFDRDSFSKSDFDNAIHKAKANNIECAYSNEAFELWYLLHFEYYCTGISRSRYQKLLSRHLKEKYRKNSEDMYDRLSDKQITAIRNAQKLYGFYNHQSISSENPSTTVYKLVDYLIKMKEIL